MNNTTYDDGFRHCPKLKCPYGNHRVFDVQNVDLRNACRLVRAEQAGDADFYFECPVCHGRLALSIRTLHISPTESAAPRGETVPSSRL